MATHQHAILQTLKDMHEDMKVESQKRFEAQKAMHEQKLELFGEFLNVLKQSKQ